MARKTTKSINLNFSPSVVPALQAKAAELGLSIGPWLRMLAYKAVRRKGPPQK